MQEGAKIIYPTGKVGDFEQDRVGSLLVSTPLPQAMFTTQRAGRFPMTGIPVVRGTVDLWIVTPPPVALELRSLFFFRDEATDSTSGFHLDANNQIWLSYQDQAHNLVGDLADEFAAEPVGRQMKLRFAWDSKTPIDGASHMIFWKNGVKATGWTSNTSPWTPFNATSIWVGAEIGSALDFNGTILKAQVSPQVMLTPN